MNKQKNCFQICLFLGCFSFSNLLNAQSTNIISLNSDWQLIATSTLTPPEATDLGRSIPKGIFNTQLPNSIFNVLLQNNALEEAVSPENATRLQWLKDKNWLFQHFFDIDAVDLEAAKINLILKGVDTYSTVFVNGNVVFNTDDAAKIWSADIKKYLKQKANLISIYFVAKPNDGIVSQKPMEKNTNPAPLMQSPGVQSVDLIFAYSSNKQEKVAIPQPIVVAAKSIKQPEIKTTPPSVPTYIKTNEKPENAAHDVSWSYRIDNDMFKLTFVNDRSKKAVGYFFLDAYDAKGNQLYADMRFMSADAGSTVEFYQQNLKTLLQGQGQALEDIEIVLRWRDEANKPQEIRKAFHLASSKKWRVE